MISWNRVNEENKNNEYWILYNYHFFGFTWFNCILKYKYSSWNCYPFGYVGIFIIIFGFWGIVAGILHIEIMSETTILVMLVSMFSVIVLSLSGI